MTWKYVAVLHVLLVLLAAGDCVLVYSSFWAPLFDRRILNYRVETPFDAEVGRSAREQYQSKYGVRGANLIADLGNGRGPGDSRDEVQSDVRFYYTYPGANQRN